MHCEGNVRKRQGEGRAANAAYCHTFLKKDKNLPYVQHGPGMEHNHRRVVFRFASSVKSLAFSFKSARRCCDGDVCRVISREEPTDE